MNERINEYANSMFITDLIKESFIYLSHFIITQEIHSKDEILRLYL